MVEITFHPAVHDVLKSLRGDLRDVIVNDVAQMNRGLMGDVHLADDISPNSIELVYKLYGSICLTVFYTEYRKHPIVYYAHQTQTPGARDELLIDVAQKALHDCMLTIDALLGPA